MLLVCVHTLHLKHETETHLMSSEENQAQSSLSIFTVIVICSLLMSYIQGAPCKARNFNVVYIYEPTFGNAESRLFLFAAQRFNIESM
jgi:hypothetical protein